MLNRSEILRAAWASYRRDDRQGLIAANMYQRFAPFSRRHFALCMRMAWAIAKDAAAKAAAAPVVVVPKVLDAATAARVEALNGSLLAMELSDTPINWKAFNALSAERTALTNH